MENLSRKALLETYIKAKDLGLADVFIKMITAEIDKRGITDRQIETFKKSYSKNQK